MEEDGKNEKKPRSLDWAMFELPSRAIVDSKELVQGLKFDGLGWKVKEENSKFEDIE